ncbi:hypothetical protein KUV65_13070 [Maritalea mobilis]|uniref:hypothetical protein n=1 Tax=Maritalea mobilis TaxID=483324 RepID=UPI001C95318D|nr:hypothetical protein [Maritalea mobilis]MBY6202302.1 hypothetical protein [Maritalea mobilis]
MSLLNKLSLTLIALLVVMAAALWIGMRPASAGVFGTPTGGWGIDAPAPAPAPGPRGGGFASSAGGSPNV